MNGAKKEEKLGKAHPRLDGLRSEFIWGVSTSSFQIEGAVHEDGRGPSVWDTYGQEGLIANLDSGDVACDHYHRYPEDVAFMRRLGVQAYRFSVAWPRVFPEGHGPANERGLAFYDRLIDAVLVAKIEPWLCLYHWDLPQALNDLGRWTNQNIVEWFAQYAALVAKRYGDRVKRFATFNEPSVFTSFGHGLGGPKGVRDMKALHQAIHNVNLSHGAAVDSIRSAAPGSLISAIHNVQPCLPCSPTDQQAAFCSDLYWNRAFVEPQCRGAYPDVLGKRLQPYVRDSDLAHINRPLDWFGVNLYGPVFVRRDPNALLGYSIGKSPASVAVSPIGWPIAPDVFRDTLLSIASTYAVPVYVTENGYGGRDKPDFRGAVIDDGRVAYLTAYISALNDAVAAGADIRGYFVWSLLDNLEWDSGYSIRFGLIYVNFQTQERIPKASFDWYRGVIKMAQDRSDV